MKDNITMIELFSGIGAQERGLRQLGLSYEVIHTCDCDKDAVLSYAAMRCNFEKELHKYEYPSQDKMIEELQYKNIGYDFQNNKHTITSRTPMKKLKQYYLADKLSKNLGDISKVERLSYADIVTYSFPCTDLSVAGKGEGMVNKCDTCGHSWPIDFSNAKVALICPQCGAEVCSSTRSGLLGQVQRLLGVAKTENTLPKYLLLENVKNLVGKKFIGQFEDWIKWLDSIGYNTYYQVLNAKHYGIPQNRERIFALSVRKDIDTKEFKFPEQISLTTRLKDVLESSIPEKYYLPDERIERILNSAFMKDKQKNVTDEIKVIGNYMPSNHDASRVVDIEGIAPTVKENHGTVTAIAEPQVIKVGQASSEGSQSGTVYSPDGIFPTLCAGCHGYAMGNILEKQEPQVLRAERTEYGKAIRKKYEAGEIKEKIGNMREMKPRTDGVSNTITTLLKDNYVVEPIIYDDYNSSISSDQDAINTLTTNCGTSAERNGVKVIEPVIVDDIYNSREPRIYNEYSPTLRSERTGLKVANKIEYPCSTRGKQVASAIRASIYKQGARNLEENVTNGLGYEGIIEEEIPKVKWRIRKLTTKECWRLMGFSDLDHDRAAKYVSSSALYKQAGNSICTSCLISIFYSLLFKDNSSKYKQYLVKFDT